MRLRGAPTSYPERNHPDVSSSRPTAVSARAMNPRPELPRAVHSGRSPQRHRRSSAVVFLDRAVTISGHAQRAPWLRGGKFRGGRRVNPFPWLVTGVSLAHAEPQISTALHAQAAPCSHIQVWVFISPPLACDGPYSSSRSCTACCTEGLDAM